MVRCPHCGLSHATSRVVCPATGLSIAQPRERRAEIGRSRARRARPEDLIGRVLDGRYKLTGLIGQGGMGTVYDADQFAIARKVAVKVLRPEQAEKREAVSRFEHEARVVGAIGHPNICQVFDIGRVDDGRPYLVMERLYGETLATRLERLGPVRHEALVGLVVQVLGALDAAHGKSIVHRDLKPDNVFLARQSNGIVAKVLDFGISKETGMEDAQGALTRPGMVMGTPYYMAPEQAMGERKLDARVDVWACGVLLYEGLAGKRPFVAKNYNALLVQILTASPPPLEEARPDLPKELADIVRGALEKRREKRIQSARELRTLLLGLGLRWGAEPAADRRTSNPSVRAPSAPPQAPSVPPVAAPPQMTQPARIGQPTSVAPPRPEARPVVRPSVRPSIRPSVRPTYEADEEPTVVLSRAEDVPTEEDTEITTIDPPIGSEESETTSPQGRRA